MNFAETPSHLKSHHFIAASEQQNRLNVLGYNNNSSFFPRLVNSNKDKI